MEEVRLNEREERLRRLEKIRTAGINPYPAKTSRANAVSQIFDDFENYQNNKTKLSIAGRIRSMRSHGNLTFANLQDDSGNIQVAFSKKEIGADNYKNLISLIDTGDFLEVSGICFITHKGEKSLMAEGWRLLSKALRPLPDKWHGIQDEEEKLRKRYLDILFNPDVKDLIEKKAKFWNAVREFMLEKGFLEVETPVLENTTGGADARPFITHHNALDMDVFLRISAGELWQKKLMVAGFEKTFEIGRIFRNEGMDAEHLQDYSQLEFYWAYADYTMGMELVEEMYRYIAMRTFGKLKFTIGKFEVDLGKKWEIYDYQETIKKYGGIDVLNTNIEEIETKLKDLKIEYDKKGFNITRAIDNLWKYARKQIGGPGFLVGVPVEVSPLAKRYENNPLITQRFQPIIAGSELGNGFSELNDPVDQASRFEDQAKLREAGDEEAQMFDHEFVEALEHGMPPTCGFGMSERVFAFLANKSMRECQIFPLLKPKNENKPIEKKPKNIQTAVALINRGANLKGWEELNTVAHLTAAFGARQGKKLLYQDTISTNDGQAIRLNIQYAIIIKQAKTSREILDLIKEAKENNLEVAEFIKEMLETTNDKKIIKEVSQKKLDDVEFLGVLIFGEKDIIEKITKKFPLY